MEQKADAPRLQKLLRYLGERLYPRISATEFRSYIVIAIAGGLIAGALGAFHDLWTYSISAEYYTKLKFKSFWFANLGLGNQAFAASVGFLAAGSAGFFVTWFLARRFFVVQSQARSLKHIAKGLLLVFVCVIVAECLGFGYGHWRGPDADYAAWYWAIEKYRIDNVWPFVRVAYIHNSAYLGGGVGLLLALWWIRPVSASHQSEAPKNP